MQIINICDKIKLGYFDRLNNKEKPNMNPKHKEILEKLKKEISDDAKLTVEEKKTKLEAVETAMKVAMEINDFKGNYSNIADTESIEKSQKATKDHVREEFNNVIKKEEEVQGKDYSSLYVKEGEPKFVIDEGIANVKKNILDKYKFKISDGFKQQVLKIAGKLEEYGITDPKYGGESGYKVYSLYKFVEVREAYLDAINKADVEKMVALKPQYDTVMNRYKELLDMTIELSKTEVVDNLDVEREKTYPPEIWHREIAVSNLNAIFQGVAYCKKHNIDFNEYLNNPYRYFQENLDQKWNDYKNEYILPKTVKLSTRLAKIIDIQTSEDRGAEYSGEISVESALASRSIELFQKLDKGEGMESRSLLSALASNVGTTYTHINNLFFTNYLNIHGVTGLKNAFLIGDTVDNLAELDPRYIDPHTLEMNKYPYSESLKNADIGNDFIEKTVTTAIDTYFEAKQMQEETDGYCGPILDGDKLLYTVTSLFKDVLMQKDLSNNPKLAKDLMEFCKHPTKYFSEIGKAHGHPNLESVNLLNEVFDKHEKNEEKLPNPMIAVNARKMRTYIGNVLDKNTIDAGQFDKVFTQLKTMQLEQKYYPKPSIWHPFKRRDWNRNDRAMATLKTEIYGKLSAFGVTKETLDEALVNTDKANEMFTNLEKNKFVNVQKMKDAFNTAFDKGTLDDMTPEQKEAYLNNRPSEELEEAKIIMRGNPINEKNLTTAVELLKELKSAGNNQDAQELKEYIFGELRDKGLDDETLRNTVDGKVKISSYIGEFANEESIILDLDEEPNPQNAVVDGKVIDLDEPVNENELVDDAKELK